MPKRQNETSLSRPEYCFEKELSGENPPSFSAFERLYALSLKLFTLRPWEFLEDSEPIVVRDSVGGELCYCSVMGALGEVYSVHAYVGPESFRLYRRIAEEQITDPGEFFASQRSVSLEFVPRSELERQDRELLAWLGHPKGKGLAAPVFRAMRPGFHPWFVTAEEAQTLEDCLRATLVVASAVSQQKRVKFWDKADVYPIVTLSSHDEPRIDLIKSLPPNESALASARLDEQKLRQLRERDYPLRGSIELDLLFTGQPIGKKNERKACASIALAVDGGSGLVYPPEITDSRVSPPDALASAFFGAVQVSRVLPSEVRVRTQEFKESLHPLLESLGVEVRATPKLRAADQARESLLQFLQGGL